MANENRDREVRGKRAIKQSLFTCLYVCIACGVISCAHYKYTESGDVSGEPASINGDNIPPSIAQIMDVDGERVGFGTSVFGTSIKLTPGEHSVRVLTFHGWNQYASMYGVGKYLHFNAEPGHNYDIRCEKTPSGMRVWVEDKTTGSVVTTPSGRAEDPAWKIRSDVGAYCPNADNGQPNAQLHIGDIYYEGTGINKDIVQAYIWYSLAAKNGNNRAADQLTKVATEMSAEQISTAKQRLGEWEPGHCQSDLTNAISEANN